VLVVSDVSKRFRGAEDPILRNVSFTVNAGECVGLIGPNGSGKSTLLRIINGEIQPDTGSVTLNPHNLPVGYLAQGVVANDAATVEEVLFPQYKALRQVEAEVERLLAQIAAGDDPATLTYDSALEELLRLSEQVDSGAGQRALARIGIDDVILDMNIGELSGGQKTRLMMASLLVQAPHLLLLDEPTNHLDTNALQWLEEWLGSFTGGVLVVSHDRAFMDRVVDRIVALDPTTMSARVHVGNYSDYVATLRMEKDKQLAQWRDQEVEIERLRSDAQQTMARAVRKENATINDHQRRLAKKMAHKAKAKEKRLERYLASEDRVEKPELTWSVKMEFANVGHIRSDAVRLEDVAIGYPDHEPLLEHLTIALRGQERIAIMGPNGHGKTTLLKTIIGEIPPLRGHMQIAGSTQIGYLAQEQEILDPRASPLDTIQLEAQMNETEARSFLHFFLFAGDDSLRPIAQLSFGERARLMLARLVARGANLLIMDEPLNHLDLPSREKFQQALTSFPGSVLAVAHDRYFVERFADKIWHIADGKLNVEIQSIKSA
jgi:ATP-binding cassette subfamily F protein 3